MLLLFNIFVVIWVALFVSAAINDFWHWKISNKTNIILTLFYLPVLGLGMAAVQPLAIGQIDLNSDLASGCLLFATGLVLYLFKMLGAGDVKFLFPIGLFVGWPNLLAFAVALILAGVVVFILLRYPLPFVVAYTRLGMRLDEIRKERKVPYGVVLVLSLLVVFHTKYLSYMLKYLSS